MADRGLGKPVTGPLQNAAAVQTASGIAGTIGNLERKLKEIEADTAPPAAPPPPAPSRARP